MRSSVIKPLSAALALILVFSAAACKRNPQKDSQTGESETTSTAAETTSAPETDTSYDTETEAPATTENATTAPETVPGTKSTEAAKGTNKNTDNQSTTAPETNEPVLPPSENQETKTMYVTANSLNVRNGASTNYKVIDKLYHCEAIQVVGESVNGWYKTIDANGVPGYCSASGLTDKAPEPNYESPYLIKVNRKQNIVIIYEKDESGKFTVPVKAMICSVGLENNTPLGIFNTTNRYEWRPLYNGVYGQYGTRVVGDIMIHSVPYFTMDKSDLEYEEYNKLGEPASLGCIRLEVKNVKWIYDNCPIGTTVIIYDSDESEPLARPTAAKIDPDDPSRGWDPTDPDENNPWNIS